MVAARCERCDAPATSGVHTKDGWRYWCSDCAGTDEMSRVGAEGQSSGPPAGRSAEGGVPGRAPAASTLDSLVDVEPRYKTINTRGLT